MPESELISQTVAKLNAAIDLQADVLALWIDKTCERGERIGVEGEIDLVHLAEVGLRAGIEEAARIVRAAVERTKFASDANLLKRVAAELDAAALEVDKP